VNYQSNNENFVESADENELSSDETREMTEQETEFVNSKITENKDKLKGIVNVSVSSNYLSF